MYNPENENDSVRRRKGVYLVVVDGTEEVSSAIDYACQFASAEGGHVALLHIIDDIYVSGWQDIEKRVQKEARSLAEERIWNAAGHVVEKMGKIPIVCVEEGDVSDIIVKTIKAYSNIVALVLAPASISSKPGPLITYFSGKGLSRLPVPLMISPLNGG